MTWIDVEEKDPLWWGLIVTACGVASAVLVYQRHTFPRPCSLPWGSVSPSFLYARSSCSCGSEVSLARLRSSS